MPNPYGTQGSPAIGRGIPGLPRRSTQAVTPATPTLPLTIGVDNNLLPFPPRADWSQGFVTQDLTITGLPTGFQLAAGQTWNGGGIALSSGEAFILPFKMSSAEDYVGLFGLANNVVTLLDYEVLPANYATQDARVLHFHRTEWPDTFLLSWAGQSGVANCASRVYVLKADPKNARLDVLPDIATPYSENTYYNRKVWVHYLKDGYVLMNVGGYSSSWTELSSPRLYKITATGLTALSTYGSGNLLFVSPVDSSGRFQVITRGTAETSGNYQRYLYQLGNDIITQLDNETIRATDYSLQNYGGVSQPGLRGNVCWFHESASYPFVLPNLGDAYLQTQAAPAPPDMSQFPSSPAFIADGGADGSLWCTSDATRVLYQYQPFSNSPGAWRYAPQLIASLGSTNYMAVHLGNRIFAMQSNGTLPKLYNANKPV